LDCSPAIHRINVESCEEMYQAATAAFASSDAAILLFNFGKYKGWDVAEILTKDPGYFTWVLGSDFTNNTKQVLTRIRLREFNKRMGK
jgi:hypothetical protein